MRRTQESVEVRTEEENQETSFSFSIGSSIIVWLYASPINLEDWSLELKTTMSCIVNLSLGLTILNNPQPCYILSLSTVSAK